jgi:hypothetical protein
LIVGFRKDWHQKLYKTPKETMEAIIGAAEHKAALTYDKVVVLGIAAGSMRRGEVERGERRGNMLT